ncbi:ion transporter [Gymnodinialimonas ceratoperidinii]|uniref:Ion transporter n=1 Tax=Gymnodinialimonas ceratoperidinii TaxID=2856823 RepID=A0A8F6Y9W9_9RHOB|nr:ion transporter [Gymnodinialimonas ceratoperidinii]QXT39369.1 ion transporter [Gymnodinialimonas ceratoperidinii]
MKLFGFTRAEVIEVLDGTHPRVGRSVALVIYALICISAVVIALETMPSLTPTMTTVLVTVEIVILTIFIIEYALRLTCSAHPIRYAFSFWGIVDFLAIVPALIFMMPDFATIRAIRLLRLLRLLKLFKANNALDRIARALDAIRAEFAIFFFIAAVALYLASVGIYHFEHQAQPEGFSSIPESLWWAIATFTTVGYGDVYPITVGGRIFTGVIMLIGIGIIAVPAGLVTAALTEAAPTDQILTKETESNRGDEQ